MNDRLAPYHVKMTTLKVGQSLNIPKSAFFHWPPRQKAKPMSDGNKTWVMIAHGEHLEVKRIE
jgi:hypothetical protein